MHAIQYMTSTFFRREEIRFSAAKARFDQTGRQAPRILSFGCSIGDEVATLRSVFPQSFIVGADVDEAALDAARRSVGHFSTIIRSDDAELRSIGPFDLITACSVLCLNPKPKDFSQRFPVSLFDEIIGLFDELLTPGGLLILSNMSYRFQDTAVAPAYDPVRVDVIGSNGFVSVMNRQGQDWLVAERGPSAIFYRKGEAFSLSDDEELADCIFEKRSDGPTRPHWVHMAPPPEDWVKRDTFSRLTSDGLKSVPDDAIIETHTYEIGAAASGTPGVVWRHSWPSVTGEGVHLRPRVWSSTDVRSSPAYLEIGHPHR